MRCVLKGQIKKACEVSQTELIILRFSGLNTVSGEIVEEESYNRKQAFPSAVEGVDEGGAQPPAPPLDA